MLLKPGADGLHGPIRQQIQRSSRFEITHQRALVQTTFVSPVINANDLSRWLSRRLGLPHEPQQAIGAAWQTQLVAKSSPGFASQGQAKLLEGQLQAQRRLGM
jgi:hypothetical protein